MKHSDATLAKKVPAPVTKNDILKSVAAWFADRPNEKFGGVEGIEHQEWETLALKQTAGTVFAAIDTSLRSAGHKTDGTIGDVMAKLGFIESKSAHKAAHDFGCHCLGEVVMGSKVSERLNQYIT